MAPRQDDATDLSLRGNTPALAVIAVAVLMMGLPMGCLLRYGCGTRVHQPERTDRLESLLRSFHSTIDVTVEDVRKADGSPVFSGSRTEFWHGQIVDANPRDLVAAIDATLGPESRVHRREVIEPTSDAPSWWNPPGGESAAVYCNNREHLTWGARWCVFDLDTGEVWYWDTGH